MKATTSFPALARRKPSNLGRRLNKSKYLLLLFAPAFIYFVVFRYLPMFGVLIAFKDYNVFKGVWDSPWVGFKHFKMFFTMPEAWRIVRNTLLLGIYTTFFGFWPPILLALLLNEIRHGMYKRVVQTVSYLPHFISTVTAVSMITVALSPDGFINDFIKSIGVEPINFLVKAEWFRTIYIGSGIWQTIGWGSIIYLASLAGVDPVLYEAAEMDGASRFRKIWHINVPAMVPTIVIILILDVGRLLEIGFEKVYLLYNPAVYSTADIIPTFVYRTGIEGGRFSLATSIDIYFGVIGIIMMYTVNYISRKVSDTSLW